MRPTITMLLMSGLALAACSGSQSGHNQRTGSGRSQSMASTGAEHVDDQGRCDATQPNHEESEYDTSGDSVPDVRKVFLQVGEAPVLRLVLICREADLNGDGTKDVVRYYTDEGRPLREEADRNFDGQMDEVAYFEDGRIIRVESDTNYDGRVDTKVFYERGSAIRAERDIAGRSTTTDWRPDRWEYFENGRMVRRGTDLDGDGSVDRWDRDENYRRQLEQQQAEQEAREAREAAEAQGQDVGDGDEGDDGG